MEYEKSIWPERFPENCPPKNCFNISILVYRFVRSDTPDEKDYQMYVEEKPHVLKKFSPGDSLDYLTLFAVSFFDSEVNLRVAAKSSGCMRKIAKEKPYISKGDTRDGIYLFCPPNSHHIELWLKKDAKPHSYFEVVGKYNEH